VLVIKAYHVYVKALETRLARRSHILPPSVDSPETAVLSSHTPKLARKDNMIPVTGYGPLDKLFVRPFAIHIRRIEKGDAELDGPVNGRDRFTFITGPIELRHAHAA
jgi:hypothetical protein